MHRPYRDRRRNLPLKVAVAGNYRLDPGMVAMHLLQELASLPIDATVILRAPLNGSPGPVEQLASDLCEHLKISVEWRLPIVGAGSLGTIERDQRMIDDAAKVIAYFHPELIMDPDTGTGRLVKMAITAEKPVEAFRPTDTAMESVGSLP